MKKSGRERKEKPYMSEPVISRGGKIARVRVDDLPETKEEKSDPSARGKRRAPVPSVRRDLLISDSEFQGGGKVTTKRSRRVHTVKSGARHPFPVVTVIACVICTLLFMSLVFNLVRINEVTKDVSGMRSEVTALEKKKDELRAELDEKNSVSELRKYIEARAESLGMVEASKMNPPIAVTPEKTDRIEEFEVSEESDAVITTVLNALAKNFSDVIAALTGQN